MLLAGACGNVPRPPADVQASRRPGEGRPPSDEGRARLLFETTCGSCHDPSGAGRPGQGPSLRASRYLAGPPEVLIRIVLDGLRTPENERRGAYLLPMPSWRILEDREVAAIATYVRRDMGHGASVVTESQVAKVRAATAGRARPWSPDELHANVASKETR